MESLCATGALAVILSAAFIRKSYLIKIAYGSYKGKNEIKCENFGRYPYQAVVMIDGMICENCALYVKNTLDEMNGVPAEVDLPKRQAIIQMKWAIGDDTLRSAGESLGQYAVTKIERIVIAENVR